MEEEIDRLLQEEGNTEQPQRRKALVVCAVGDRFIRQTELMIDSFMRYNAGWDVIRYYDRDLYSVLPDGLHDWSPFNACEIGRLYALKETLKNYDTAFYCDGDFMWYGEHKPLKKSALTLWPHYLTDNASRSASYWLAKDGIYNCGEMECSAGKDSIDLLEALIRTVMVKPSRHFHANEQLWLQNLYSYVPNLGYPCKVNRTAGENCAFWNFRHGDRQLTKENGRYFVICNGKKTPLVCWHFSRKSLGLLQMFGSDVSDLLSAYISELGKRGVKII